MPARSAASAWSRWTTPSTRSDPAYGGPEYETIGAFGSNCGVDDLRAIAKANELCNAYGLDTIAAGMMVSFAMECFENGLLTLEDTGGLDLRFGNGEAMVELTRQIGEREGLGDLLAEGPQASRRPRSGAGRSSSPSTSRASRSRCTSAAPGTGRRWAMPSRRPAPTTCTTSGMAACQKEPVGEDLQSWGVYESVPQTELNAHKVRAYMHDDELAWVDNHLGMCMFIPWSANRRWSWSARSPAGRRMSMSCNGGRSAA